MSRPPKITDAQILAAARETFLERGFTATTAEVARRAGIAEGSIFNRFPTKVELFHAAMKPDLEALEWLQHLEARVGKGDVRATLTEIGRECLAFFRRIMPLIVMSWSNPTPSGLPAPLTGPNPPPLRALKRMTGYFEAEMRAGRLRRRDPEILARTYMGGIQNYVFFELILRVHDELPLPEEVFLRGLVELLWGGVHPISEQKLKNRGVK